MKIDLLAINYRQSTDARNCTNCVYKEIITSTGLTCVKWGEPTRSNMICAEHIPEYLKKEREKKAEQENTLF